MANKRLSMHIFFYKKSNEKGPLDEFHLRGLF